jgi:hypothetical protein
LVLIGIILAAMGIAEGVPSKDGSFFIIFGWWLLYGISALANCLILLSLGDLLDHYDDDKDYEEGEALPLDISKPSILDRAIEKGKEPTTPLPHPSGENAPIKSEEKVFVKSLQEEGVIEQVKEDETVVVYLPKKHAKLRVPLSDIQKEKDS